MSHEPYETQAAAYALGALDSPELEEFERHLAGGCPTCEEILRESGEALVEVARAEPARIPPPAVREALLRRVAGDGTRAIPRSRGGWWWRWTLATAAVAVVVAFFTGMFVAARYEARLGQLAREASALRQRLTATENVLALLRDPSTRVIALRGTGPIPDAEGRLIWNPTAGGQLLVSKLPPAPAGKAYELWTISGGQPSPAGVFRVDASGQAIHAVAPRGGPVDIFAVTLEPAAGVLAPTGPIVLASAR